MKRIPAVIVLFIFAFLSAGHLCAQDTKLIPITRYRIKDTATASKKDTAQQKDLSDILGAIFRKNYKPSAADTIGPKPIVSFVPAAGYSLQTKAAATFTGNIVFRLAPDARVSAITTSMGFTQRRQFTLPIVSTIWTKGDEYLFVGDTRFYVYPQSTYGLGSNSNIDDEQYMRYNFFRFSETVFKKITGNFYLGFGYRLQDHWNISYREPLDGAPSDYEAYENDKRTISAGVNFNALFDSRDNSVNPSKGFYATIQYSTYDRVFGSNNNWQSLIIDLRKYYNLPAGSDNVIAFWSYDWLTLSGRPPYLDLPSTGWDTYTNTGRGYIQSRFRGSNMVYAETEYRFKITNNGVLGGVVFLNGESLSEGPGTKLESIQPGYGPGLRLKLSKVSKTNLDIDYGFGNEGSRGLFLSVGEVF